MPDLIVPDLVEPLQDVVYLAEGHNLSPFIHVVPDLCNQKKRSSAIVVYVPSELWPSVPLSP